MMGGLEHERPTPFTPALTLTVHSNSMGTAYTLTDPTTTTTNTSHPIYTAKATTLSGHMTITTGPNSHEVGSANYRTLSSKIDILVHGQRTTLTKADRDLGHGKDSQHFESIAQPGMRRVWRDAADAKNELDMVCVDEGGAVVARFCFADSLRRLNDLGRLELGESVVAAAAAGEGRVDMDEVVVTGMAVAQVRVAAS